MIINNRINSGPSLFAKILTRVQDVETYLKNFPQGFICRLFSEVAMSKTSVVKIIHDELKFFSYKLQDLEAHSLSNKIYYINLVSKSVNNSSLLSDVQGKFFQ